MIKLPAHALRTAVDRVIPAVQRNATLPILQHLVIQVEGLDLTVTATNLELQISTRVPLDLGSGGSDIGAAPAPAGHTLPAHKLHGIARALDPEAVVALEETAPGQIALRAGRSRYRLHSLPGAEYPRMETPDDTISGANAAHFAPRTLVDLLRRTAPAIAKSDVRYYLNGLFIPAVAGSALDCIATDGHRLHHLRLAHDGELLRLDPDALATDAIIPGDTIDALLRLINPKDEDERIILRLSERTIAAHIGDTTLHSKLIDGRYPDWRRVIPERHDHCVRLPRQPLRDALAQITVISDEKVKGVRAVFRHDGVELDSTNTDREEANNAVGYTTACDTIDSDNPVTIGFNVDYLDDALACISTDDCLLRITDSDKSAILTPTNADDTYVVMPMRI